MSVSVNVFRTGCERHDWIVNTIYNWMAVILGGNENRNSPSTECRTREKECPVASSPFHPESSGAEYEQMEQEPTITSSVPFLRLFRRYRPVINPARSSAYTLAWIYVRSNRVDV